MSPPTPVAHVITRLDIGGAQATAVRICARLDRDRFEPVLVAGCEGGSGGSMVASAEEAGVRVIPVPELVGPIRLSQDARAVSHLRRVLRGVGARIVHTHSSKAGALGRFAAPRGASCVHTVHGWSFNDGVGPGLRHAFVALERLLARRTGALVVVTTVDRSIGLANKIGRAGQYRLIRSGIELPTRMPTDTERATIRHELGWAPEQYGIMMIGRLEAQKDPLTLVRALRSVIEEEPGVRVALVGDGSLREAVEQALTREQLSGSVRLLGVREDAQRLLAGADLHVSAARWEGLPRTLLEASALGIPSVVTDVGGVREIIEHGRSGLLVGAGDAAGLASAILQMVRCPAEARSLGAFARSRTVEFSEDEMVERTMELYEHLLAKREVSRRRPNRASHAG